MANLIPEELDALIQQYLTDGVLTDKERQVILNKADKMGLDRDEIDLYLDAEIQKIDQTTDAAVRKQKGKVCPYCGASIPLLADKCPACDRFITPEASKELQDILDNLEEALVDLKSGKDLERNKATVERYARKAKLYYNNNPKIKILLEEVEKEMIEAEKNLKSSKRNDFILSLLSFMGKGKFWGSLGVVIGLICMGTCTSNMNWEDGSADGNLGEFFKGFIGFLLLVISLVALLIMSRRNKNSR